MVCCSPYDIGDRAQLFVDSFLVRESRGISFTQHPGTKHPRNPLVTADKPWDGWRIHLYGSVVYDEEERLFKMWYLNDQPEWFDRRYNTCYAVSEDGISWQKPTVGTIPSKTGLPHAAVCTLDTVSVMKEPDDPDPQRRYKLIGFCPEPRGYFTFISPDGFHWTRESPEPIAPFCDVISAFWDKRNKRYAAFPKTHQDVWMGHKRRLFNVIFSEDFRRWTPPQPAFRPDLRDEAGMLARLERARPILDRPDDPALMRTEFYGVGFYQQESCTLGFPWVFTINNHAYYGNDEGVHEIQLAISRDLLSWERPFRTPIIEFGALGEWDCGSHLTAAEAIRVGDEIRLYYGGANYTHGTPALSEAVHLGQSSGRGTLYTSSIGLVSWPLDRFVSADSPRKGGTLTTIPVTFSGGQLELNARTHHDGYMTVELMDAGYQPLSGLPPSDPIHGDSLRHPVRFGSTADLSSWAGKPIALRFTMYGAELYSFAFRRISP